MMRFQVVEEEFGTKRHPYSNDPQLDAECILKRIAELKSNGPARHVVFVGESHDSYYDKQRRISLIDEIHYSGKKHFPDGAPKVIAERFKDVNEEEVDWKEPNVAENIPEPFCKLRKPDTNDETKATGVITEQDRKSGTTGPLHWS